MNRIARALLVFLIASFSTVAFAHQVFGPGSDGHAEPKPAGGGGCKTSSRCTP
jgi:hypothetical protein